MKQHKSARFPSGTPAIIAALSAAWLAHFAAPSADATPYYWDNDGATAGFGTAAGTWAAPTTGDATQGWSTSTTGELLPGNITTTTGDSLNFGNGATGLASGPITVSGTVDANKVTIASGSGVITLSGGTIALGGTAPAITVSKAGQIIGSALTLNANTSVVAGIIGNPVLSLNGVIGGSGNLTFTTTSTNFGGKATVIPLGAASDYSGSTLITLPNTTQGHNNALTVKATAANALPATTVLTLDGYNGAGSGRQVAYDLNGKSQTLAGLTNVARTLRFQRILNSTGTATLTIDNASDYTFSGNINGTGLGLTKSGAGKMILSGTNAYSGNTTVNGGTLSLGSANTGNDLSTVTIAASGATLELAYASGTDTVDKLFIGDTQLAAGIYGPGNIVISQITSTGTGTLTVAHGPVGPGFSSWITGAFANGTVPGDKQGPNDDPDNDGIPNLVEYAIDAQDPTVANASIGSFNGTTLSFTKRASASGLSYAIQESTDLGAADAWAEVPAGPSYTNDATTISYTLPGGPPKDFLRLQVLSN